MKKQRATISKPGVPGRSEPYAKLDDGREMPMGWSMGQVYIVGERGTAEYISTPTAGLWKFTPDPIVCPTCRKADLNPTSWTDYEGPAEGEVLIEGLVCPECGASFEVGSLALSD